MKNRLFISVLAVALTCSFASVASAVDTEGYEAPVNYEMSQDELNLITEDCNDIGIESEMTGEELAAYVDECVSVNTMVMEEDNAEPAFDEAPMDLDMPSEMDSDDVMMDETEITIENSEG
ncbi:hypothetical protein [Leucothrix arctica]|uniref:Uncharacterized protein n=1 Tax=Leucothrix arctica TaxID=1481894 RepID=A0A317C580_9GAMM|nr:hypothetical protein [Leucothrix arctica]PWQ93748.1 hypothetical protein DKT75_19250 [Leucothrix arctica]